MVSHLWLGCPFDTIMAQDKAGPYRRLMFTYWSLLQLKWFMEWGAVRKWVLSANCNFICLNLLQEDKYLQLQHSTDSSSSRSPDCVTRMSKILVWCDWLSLPGEISHWTTTTGPLKNSSCEDNWELLVDDGSVRYPLLHQAVRKIFCGCGCLLPQWGTINVVPSQHWRPRGKITSSWELLCPSVTSQSPARQGTGWTGRCCQIKRGGTGA